MYDSTVFKQWALRPSDQRFETLTDLHEAVLGRKQRSAETLCYTADLFAADMEGGIGFEIAGSGYSGAPTHWAFTQACRQISAPPSFLRRLAPAASVATFNAAREVTGEGVACRVLLGDNQIRAVTSASYGRIYDSDVVELVMDIVDRSNGAFYNPPEWGGKPGGLYASDSDCFAFMVDGGSLVEGRGERDVLHRGFYVRNSEVGKSSFLLRRFLFQEVCGNYQIWGMEDVKEIRLRHTVHAPNRYRNESWGVVTDWVNSDPRLEVGLIEKAKRIELPVNDNARIEWFFGRGFTKIEARAGVALAENEIGECKNVWQAVDGLTMYARTIQHADEKYDLEIRAGALMKLAA